MAGILEAAFQRDLRHCNIVVGLLEQFSGSFQPRSLQEFRRRATSMLLKLPKQAPRTHPGDSGHIVAISTDRCQFASMIPSTFLIEAISIACGSRSSK